MPAEVEPTETIITSRDWELYPHGFAIHDHVIFPNGNGFIEVGPEGWSENVRVTKHAGTFTVGFSEKDDAGNITHLKVTFRAPDPKPLRTIFDGRQLITIYE